jgi:hypothetical protein
VHRFGNNLSQALAQVRDSRVAIQFLINFLSPLVIRSNVEKLKNAKTVDISAKSMIDCQLQSMSQVARENGSISTPLVGMDGSLMRQSPMNLMMSDAPDADDTDPDVIPNQYGE